MHVWVTPNAQVGRTAPHLLLINLWGPAQRLCAWATSGRASTRHQMTQACWPLSIYRNLKTTPSSRHCSRPLPQPQSPQLRPLPQKACPNATHWAHLCHGHHDPSSLPGHARTRAPPPPSATSTQPGIFSPGPVPLHPLLD